MKTCRTCLRYLSESEFGQNKKYSDGLNSQCRGCVSDYHNSYYNNNREKIIRRTSANKIKWQKQNPELAAQINREYAEKNAEKISNRKRAQRATEAKKAEIREYSSIYRDKNREYCNAKSSVWNSNNRERVRARHSKMREEKPHVYAEYSAKRHVAKLNAVPKWADRKAIRLFYKEAARLTRETGIKHEVDHIVPIQGKLVCGLHCEANLQVLTKQQNISKHNKWPIAA